jgi:hypothetical protein
MNIKKILIVCLVITGINTSVLADDKSAPVIPVPVAPVSESPPNFEVMLATLDIANNQVGKPLNISNHQGYDNQPAFLLDGSGLYFVSDRTGSTDVYRYDIKTNKTTQITNTVEGEFSPTPFADGNGFSVIRVATPNAQGADSTNPPVWRYNNDGTPGEKILDILGVGYHAWFDNDHLALFVVGDEEKKTPHTLVLANRNTNETILLSSAPGRQLGRTPDGQRVSFVDKSDPDHWVVAAIAPGDTHATILVDTPQGGTNEKEQDRSEDYCWLPDGSLMMAKGNFLLRWSGEEGDGFQTFAEMDGLDGDIKRLAVSKDGKYIAVVVQIQAK